MDKKFITISAFIITTILISLLLPSSEIFKSSHKVGEKWEQSDYYAPYDFPILKSQQEYNKDIANAERRHIPIFSFNREIPEKMQQLLSSKLSVIYNYNKTDSLEKSISKELLKTLQELYNHGITNEEMFDKEIISLSKDGSLSTASPKDFITDQNAKIILNKILHCSSKLSDINADDYIIPNILINSKLNDTELQTIKLEIPRSKGYVLKESLIIKKDEIVTKDIYEKLTSLEEESKLREENKNSINLLLGNFLYVGILLSLSFVFLCYFRKDFAKKTSNMLFILFVYFTMALVSFIVSKFSFLSIYIIPFAIVPFYIVTFYDIRMSIFEYTLVLLICSSFSHEPLSFFIINLTAGLAGIFTVQNSYYRRKMMFAVGVILFTYSLSYIALSLKSNLDFNQIKWSELIWFVLNIILFLGLYQLVYVLERVFGFVTDITLFELSDTNNSLLRQLAETAPGTFQHSMQVANLSEAAAKAIGANPLYARTGALYHDIGKIENPQFFIENNLESLNPHNDISPLESAQIIKAHVDDGVKLSKKHNLPSVITDFITMHHSDSLIYYFYHKQRELNHGEQVDESLFRYNGTAPISKEVTICMMADSVEAASRSLATFTKESISDLVEKIITSQMNEGNFKNSLLSFAEITETKEVFKSKIEKIYHKRVAYPQKTKNN